MEEEEVGARVETEEQIDIVGETAGQSKPAGPKLGERKAVKRGGCYGPEQFTEDDLQTGGEGAGEEEGEEADHDPTRWCSQCQASTTYIVIRTLVKWKE